ncbi:TPA: DUF1835 domain-containing protein, partial [Pseudomonas aeruginosa]
MSFSRILGDGRINLEQQRKRAKELLRQWRRDPASRTGLPGQAPRLADAQWQVARELGFASWPRLKAHVDAIAFASRHPDLVGGDEAATLHLRCGNDIAHGLKLAGFRGGFRMFADPLTMGPVPNLPLPEFLALRSDYLSRAFDLDPADAQARQRQEYAGLTARREPLPYLGDLMFRVLLRALLEEPGALLRTPAPELPWERQPLALTAAGREVLAGRRYRLDLGAPERWVGGVRLRAGTAH